LLVLITLVYHKVWFKKREVWICKLNHNLKMTHI